MLEDSGLGPMLSTMPGGEVNFLPSQMGDIFLTEYRPSVSEDSQTILKHCTREVRDKLVTAWEHQHRMFFHKDAEEQALPRTRLRICHVAGFCVCKGASQQFKFFHDEVMKRLRIQCPPHSHSREALKNAGAVIRFVQEARTGDGQEDVWFHIADINLRDWYASLFNVYRDVHPVREMRARPNTALKADLDRSKWKMTWAAYRDHLNLNGSISFDLWELAGNSQQRCLDLEPWSLQVVCKTMLHQVWEGPREPRQRLQAIGEF